MKLQVTHSTRWHTRADGLVIPGHLMIQVTSQVGLDTAIPSLFPMLANAANAFLPMISVATNAGVPAPSVEVMASTPHANGGEYFQAYVEPEPDEPYAGRMVPVEQTVRLIAKIGAHPESGRLLRACMQYMLSLLNLEPARANVSLALLWMAVEALTHVELQALVKSKGVADADGLADEFGIQRDPNRSSRAKQLDAYIRKTYLLNDDSECYKACRSASDGFEHGYMDVGEIGAVSFSMRSRLAAHVRNSILRLSGLYSEDIQRLETTPYAVPLQCAPARQYRHVHGAALGKSDVFRGGASSGHYPPLHWKSQLTSVSVENCALMYEFSDQITPNSEPGISFDARCFQVKQ